MCATTARRRRLEQYITVERVIDRTARLRPRLPAFDLRASVLVCLARAADRCQAWS